MDSKFARFAVCAALVSLAVAAGCSVSPEQERAIGAGDAAKIDSEMPLIRDSAIDQFVTKLGQSMASRTSRATLDWRFSVVNSPEVNDFALPAQSSPLYKNSKSTSDTRTMYARAPNASLRSM
jgi:predicted Zn-dependent protease